MENLLYYLLRASVYLFVFAGAYAWLFRKQQHPAFNRFYLLGSSIATLLLALQPYQSIPIGANTQLVIGSMIVLPEVVLNAQNAGNIQLEAVGGSYTVLATLFQVYLLIVAVFILLLLRQLAFILRLISKHERILQEGMTVILLPEGHVPFSFFKWIFMPKNMLDKPYYKMILTHEKAHYRLRHSVEVQFYALLQVLFWFHPVAYWLRREAGILHEYEADDVTISQFEKASYQSTLLNCAMAGKPTVLVNPFNISPLKKRIMKMNQSTHKNRLMQWLKLAIIVPFVLMTLVIQSCYQRKDEVEKQQEHTLMDGVVEKEQQDGKTISQGNEPAKDQMITDTVFAVVEEMPVFPGGTEAMMIFMAENIRYPEQARKDSIQGRVFVNFIIEADGKVSNANVLRGIGGGCDEEAMRVVELMPDWTPGYQRGQAVRVSFNMPIMFALQ